MTKRARRVLLVAGILVLLGLSLPVSNLLVALPHSAKFAAVPGSDPLLVAARQVMQGKCSHCHADDVALPFYAALPGAKSQIQKDVQRGLAYLNLCESFPGGQGVAGEVALAQIEHALDQNTMPPTPYLAMHWNASLSSQDRQTLTAWIGQTRARHYAPGGTDARLQQAVIPPLPAAHGQDPRKVALGEKLYNDKRLSKDNTIACASCHLLDKGGTDQEPVATGVGNAKGPINSPTVFNALYNVKQFWDGRAADLKDQAAGPVENPLEMAEKWDNVIEKLRKDEAFKGEFEKEYPGGLSKDTVTEAIATFERTLITPNSRFDRFLAGDQSMMTAAEQEGWRLFRAEGCATCHCGKAMGGQSFEKMGRDQDYFGPRGNVKEADFGRFNATRKESDKHRFKVPTLRNIEVTFPYFHDASAKDLETATKVMAEVQYGKKLSKEQVGLIAGFLKTLTGEYQGKSLAPKK